MSLTLPELTRIAEAVVREEAPGLTLINVASSDAETGRLELLVTVTGCHREPCTFLINLARQERRGFEAALRDQFRAAVASHQKSGAGQ